MGSVKKGKTQVPKKPVKTSRKSKVQLKDSKVSPRSQPAVTGQSNSGYSLLGSLALILWGLLSFPNFRILFTSHALFYRLFNFPWLLLVGFLWLVFSFRALPEASKRSELSKLAAYPWF